MGLIKQTATKTVAKYLSRSGGDHGGDFREHIRREDIRAYSDPLYVFGDNLLQRNGNWSQLREHRSEAKSIGLAYARCDRQDVGRRFGFGRYLRRASYIKRCWCAGSKAFGGGKC